MATAWLTEHPLVALDKSAPLPLQQQLYRAIRGAIVAGDLPPGRRLPASRALASELGIGRNTVVAAYAQLEAEGWLRSRVGAGSYVAYDAQLAASQRGERKTPRHEAGIITPPAAQLSQRALSLVGTAVGGRASIGAFVPALPDVREFPAADFARRLASYWRAPQLSWLCYGRDAGLPELRAAIADHLRVARAVTADADQVLVLPSAQAALSLLATALADPGACVALENPGYTGARAAFIAAGLQVLPVPVDDGGLMVSALPERAPPQLIYVTPSHQFPLGAVMDVSRRQALLDYAHRHGSLIIEDDYDSEFRYRSRPLASLQGQDRDGRVLYIGTFSKVLTPALRTAYLVVPKALAPQLNRLAQRLIGEGHYPTQAALADFLRAGKLVAHIRRTRALYAERQAALREALDGRLPTGWRLSGGDAGLHLVLHAPADVDDRQLAEHGVAYDLLLRPLSACDMLEPPQRGFMLGYASCDPDDLRAAAARLLDLLHARR